MFAYGNPIILEGSGRIKTDPVNEQRVEAVLKRFQEWAAAHGQIKKLSYAVSEEQKKRSLIAFPVAGLAVLIIATSWASFHRLPLCTPTLSTSASASH